MQTQEVLNEDTPRYLYFAYRAGASSSEAKDLINSTRAHIARTYIHKLVS